MILDAAKFVANKADIAARVFMSVGGAEEASMVSDMQKVAETLKETPSNELRLTAQVFEGEIHASVIPAHISRGMWDVYG